MEEEIINNVAKDKFNMSYEEYAKEQGKDDIEWDKALIDETCKYIVKNIKTQ